MTALNFDLTPVAVDVVINGDSYQLREATELTAVQYRNKLFEATKLMSDGKATATRGLADVEPFLVSQCLFDANEKQVPLSKVNTWPNRVVKKLFQTVKDISELDKKDNEEESTENTPDPQSGV